MKEEITLFGQHTTMINEKLEGIDVEKISNQTGFTKRKENKLTARNFLMGFLELLCTPGERSYRLLAVYIGFIINTLISKQAIWKRVNSGQVVEFLSGVLSEIMKKKGALDKINTNYDKLSQFNNIYIEDSTCIKLNQKLESIYPGNRSNDKRGKAVMKIQLTYNLLKQSIERIAIQSFRNNDQQYSGAILKILKKRDLVIRDLGYFVIKVFEQIEGVGAYYLSRFKMAINVYSLNTKERIDLIEMLKRSKGIVDLNIALSLNYKLPTRLVAIPLSEEIANQRRMKAKKNRDPKSNPSKEHLMLLGWAIFITNVPSTDLSAKDIAVMYRIRWKIESIFKCWKTYFRIDDIPQNAGKNSTDTFIYASLIYITLFQDICFNYIEGLLLRLYNDSEKRPDLSLNKVMDFIIIFINYVKNIALLGVPFDKKRLDFVIEQMNYHCRYDKRKRLNLNQIIYSLG